MISHANIREAVGKLQFAVVHRVLTIRNHVLVADVTGIVLTFCLRIALGRNDRFHVVHGSKRMGIRQWIRRNLTRPTKIVKHDLKKRCLV